MRRERRRQYQAQAVGGLLGERLRTLGYDSRIREHTAPLVWAELVGPQIAAATEVDKVKDGVLYVSTRSAMWSTELTFHKADILRRLNVRIGANPAQPLIIDIRFQNRGLQLRDKDDEAAPVQLHPSSIELDDVDLSEAEKATIEAGIAVIADEALRARLRRLRTADARLRTWRLDNGWGVCPQCGDIAPPSAVQTGQLACSRCRLIVAYSQR